MLIIEVPADVAALPGLEIRRGDELIDQKQWNNGVRVKPGKHTVRVFAPGKQRWEGTINAEHDSVATLKVGPMADEGAAPAKPTPATDE
jgi:hypothetical protein